jgi:hypothetical protein
MRSDSGQPMIMFRHATPARRKSAWDAIQILDVGRTETLGYGPDKGETMVPWLRTSYHRGQSPWVLCARFKNETWIHCIASSAGLASIERFGSTKDLQVLATWYDADENRTCARYYKQRVLAAVLAVTGKGDNGLEVQEFRSSAHPKTLLKGCKTVRQALDAFFSKLDAEPRDLVAGKVGCGLELRDGSGRAIQAKALDELGIRYYAPVAATESPASVALKEAIESGDVLGVRQAIADGASLEFLPDLFVSPLAIAFDARRPGDWRSVAKLLVEAGAPIDGYDWEDPPIFNAFAAMGKEASIIKNLEAALSLGADINSPERGLHPGFTLLHLAVQHHYPEVVRFLLDQGATLGVRNADGATPLDLAESLAEDDPPCDDSEEATAGQENPRDLTPMELFARRVSGTSADQVRRRAAVVQMLCDATSRANRR